LCSKESKGNLDRRALVVFRDYRALTESQENEVLRVFVVAKVKGVTGEARVLEVIRDLRVVQGLEESRVFKDLEGFQVLMELTVVKVGPVFKERKVMAVL
jgi:hypothetical protein